MNISFSRAFERAVCHSDPNFDINKVPLKIIAPNVTGRYDQAWSTENSLPWTLLSNIKSGEISVMGDGSCYFSNEV